MSTTPRRHILRVPNSFGSLAVVVGVIVLVWLAAPYLAVKLLALYGPMDVDKLGPFGDIFGMINALFSGCAFAALIVALLMQKAELQLQREELLETRRVFERQSATLVKQNFESTFFSMLRLYQEIVASMTVIAGGPSERRELHGREVIQELYKRLHNEIWNDQAFRHALDPAILLNVIGGRYLKFQTSCESMLGNYYRTLYNILKFIARSDVEDKRLYTNLVRAQLNSDELKLLFFNCLSPIGYEKFKPLVEEFTLLESVVEDEIIRQRTRALYKPTAFAR